MRSVILATLLAGAGLATAQATAVAQTAETTDVSIDGSIYRPAVVEATEQRIGSLRPAEGWRVEKFVDGLESPRILAVAPDGMVYVTRRKPGDVLLLRDVERDGKVDRVEEVAEKPQVHGIAIDGDTVWLVAVNEVFRAIRNPDGTFGELQTIVDDLPDAGQHPNRTIAVGPDGKLYISVGSTCNECAESNPENGTILRMDPDGGNRTIMASGLRNTIGFGWEPSTGALWGMDHGIDWLGDRVQREELNRIEVGKLYGWPYAYEDGRLNARIEPPAGMSKEQWAASSTAPVLTYDAHAAPMQMAFVEGDALVTMRGSWNTKPPTGYEVVRIRFNGGQPEAFEPFLTGFVQEDPERGHVVFGRPVGLAAMPDGSLLIGDDTNGVVYRMTRIGKSG